MAYHVTLLLLLLAATCKHTHSMIIANSSSELFKNYEEVLNYSRTWNVALTIPKLLLVGVQSVGKTSLIENLIGFPVGPTKTGTGTRCPVMYTLRTDDSVAKPLVHVNGEKLASYTDLRPKIEQLTQEINPHFSSKAIEVTINCPKCPNIIITDLPGLLTNSEPNALEILKIMQLHARDPTYKLIVLLKCTESYQTMFDEGRIHEIMINESVLDPKIPPPRANWRQDSVFIVNMCNFALFKTTIAANEFLIRFAIDFKKYIVNLNPDMTADDVSFAVREEYLQKLIDKEETFMKSWKGNLTGSSWNPEYDKLLGLRNAHNAIDKLWVQSFSQQIPAIMVQVVSRQQELQSKKTSVDEKLSLVDPQMLQQLYFGYTGDFIAQFLALEYQNQIKDIHSMKESLSTQGYHRFSGEVYGRTYKQQMNDYKAWPHPKLSEAYILKDVKWRFIPYDELQSQTHLGSHRLGQMLDWKLVGSADIERALKISIYNVLAQPQKNYTEVDIVNFVGYMQDNSNLFPIHTAVAKLAADQIRTTLLPGMRWALAFVYYVLQTHTQDVQNYLLSGPKYMGLADHYKFQELFSSSLDILLNQCAELVRHEWENAVEHAAEFFTPDFMQRMIVAFALAPVETIIPTSIAELRTKPLADNGISPNLPGLNSGQRFRESKKSTPEESPRRAILRTAINQFEQKFYEAHQTFNLADFVYGGLVVLKNQDKASIDYEYIKAVAHQQYLHNMCTLIIQLEGYFDKYFLKGINTKISNELIEIVRKSLPKDENEIIAMANIDAPALSQQKLHIESELSAIEKMLARLRQLQIRTSM